MLSPTFFINVFYLDLFCIHVCVDDVLEKKKLKKRLRNLYKKEHFKPEIKPMIENFQDKLYQLENKQAKGAKVRSNMR